MAADLPTAWGVRDSRVDSAAAEREIKPCVSRVWEAHQWSKWSFGGDGSCFLRRLHSAGLMISPRALEKKACKTWNSCPVMTPPPPTVTAEFMCWVSLVSFNFACLQHKQYPWCDWNDRNCSRTRICARWEWAISRWRHRGVFFSLPPTSPWHVTAGHCHLSHARAPLKRVLSLARYRGARTIVRKAAASVQARRRIHKLCRAVTLSQGNNTDFVFKVFAGCCWVFFFCSGSGGIKVSNPRG